MSEPFLGELRLVSFNFPPKGWAFSNGQLLPINQNQALFALLGTMYGGDGQRTFALPNLQGRAPIHVGQGFTQGQVGGEYAHTLTTQEMPAHIHVLQAQNTPANLTSPQNNLLGNAPSLNIYTNAVNPSGTLTPATIGNVGGSQPHANQSPFLVLNWIIALQGIFPSRN